LDDGDNGGEAVQVRDPAGIVAVGLLHLIWVNLWLLTLDMLATYLENTKEHVGGYMIYGIVYTHVCVSVEIAYGSALETIYFEHVGVAVIGGKSEY
jgi:hypothetical protein